MLRRLPDQLSDMAFCTIARWTGQRESREIRLESGEGPPRLPDSELGHEMQDSTDLLLAQTLLDGRVQRSADPAGLRRDRHLFLAKRGRVCRGSARWASYPRAGRSAA